MASTKATTTTKRPAIAKQRPEALAELAQSARDEQKAGKKLVADARTKPIPTDNDIKHGIAEHLLNDGAHGDDPDPAHADVDELPDRIIDSRGGVAGTEQRSSIWAAMKSAMDKTFHAIHLR